VWSDNKCLKGGSDNVSCLKGGSDNKCLKGGSGNVSCLKGGLIISV